MSGIKYGEGLRNSIKIILKNIAAYLLGFKLSNFNTVWGKEQNCDNLLWSNSDHVCETIGSYRAKNYLELENEPEVLGSRPRKGRWNLTPRNESRRYFTREAKPAL